MSLRIPSKATLSKYGLSEDEWAEIAGRNHGRCEVCDRTPSTGILHIDHEHVRGWKKMPPIDRKKHVRGVCCQMCNRFYLAKGMTAEKAQRMAAYLLSKRALAIE